MISGMSIRRQLFDKLEADIIKVEKDLRSLKLMKKKYESITPEQIIMCKDIFTYLNTNEVTIYNE